MKISNSKKQLAKIISENGGWRERAKFAAQDQDGDVCFYAAKPTRSGGWWLHVGGLCGVYILCDEALPNWHQTALSCDEYFHLYPAPDAGHAETEYPDGVKPTDPAKVDGGSKPAIEQLAADYKAKLATARRAQEEADLHRCGAEAALERLYQAGLAIGLDIAIADSEPEDKRQPELMITDWRDLRVGDEVMCVGHSWPGHFEGLTCEVIGVEREGYHGDAAIRVQSYSGGKSWGLDFKFIRRP